MMQANRAAALALLLTACGVAGGTPQQRLEDYQRKSSNYTGKARYICLLREGEYEQEIRVTTLGGVFSEEMVETGSVTPAARDYAIDLFTNGQVPYSDRSRYRSSGTKGFFRKSECFEFENPDINIAHPRNMKRRSMGRLVEQTLCKDAKTGVTSGFRITVARGDSKITLQCKADKIE